MAPGQAMIEIELRKHRDGLGHIVEYVTLWCPLTDRKDFGCSKPGVLSFDDARRLAELISAGQRSGEINEYKWRVL